MFKKRKTSELTGAALDWAVAKCLDGEVSITDERGGWLVVFQPRTRGATGGGSPFPPMFFNPSKDWAKGGPIIERENISVIRLEDESIPDSEGFWQGKYLVQWGAVIDDQHTPEKQYGSQGDDWGQSYHVDSDAVIGPTPLIAAMRCYVAAKLSNEVEIPEELE
jgi:hypothetical protein